VIVPASSIPRFLQNIPIVRPKEVVMGGDPQHWNFTPVLTQSFG
jgi:hypothetical protein